MARLLKLMTDYDAFPLWELFEDGVRNVSPDELPLSGELRAALVSWAAAYDGTLDPDDPALSGFASPAEEDAFEAEGRRLCQELQAQLGPAYQVVYYSWRDSRVL
jgi:hypothetical protein